MMLMAYFALILGVLGLCMGSFINALVWRVHEQAEQAGKKNPDKKYLKKLSVTKGRSMCPHCKHELAVKDLIPVASWLSLRGKCRYCGKPIPDSPLVEIFTGAAFAASYLWWPEPLKGAQIAVFGLWLALLVGLIALLIYDLRWMLLPDRIVYPLALIAAVQAAIIIAASAHPVSATVNALLGVLVGGGLFYLLFQLSDGKWIGGGDVKLGFVLGLMAGSAARSFLLIFVASLAGSLISLPFLLSGRLKRSSTIPFGPFLILAIIVVQLFGADVLEWYRQTFINF